VASAPLWGGGPGTPQNGNFGEPFPTRTSEGNFGAARSSKMESLGNLSKFGDDFGDVFGDR